MEKSQEIKRPKLLIADDSVTVRKVVELTFAEEGVDVFAAGDGEAAMKRFVEIEPDIVLADVNMPDPTGYHICEMIKQDETTKDIPVLLLVGSFEPFDTAEAERVGADGFLTKPFQSVRELVARVSELLGNENGIPLDPVDTGDIENLYESSFAEPYRHEETKDTLLGDAGMDDDLIETSHAEGEPEPTRHHPDDISTQETVSGYDWMSEHASETEEQPATQIHEFAQAPQFNDADEQELSARIDELEPHEQHPEPEFERVVDEFQDTLEVEPDAGGESAGVAEEAQETHLPEDDHFHEGEESASTPDISDIRIPEHPHERHDDPSVYIPSEEFLDIIARRVIEKLSDKAVRDIARESVPRIAEKLIREALDQDSKKRRS